MLFSSITFLFYFLPVVLILYFAVPKFLKNTVLLLASMLFYAWGEPKYAILMIVTIIIGYASGILIEKFNKNKIIKKTVLIISCLIITFFLCWFKYADFFISNFNAITGLSIPLLRLALPIGISFYTFQILSYVIDVYRGTPSQRNLISLATYVSLFPQLVAGPIVRYTDIAQQLNTRTHSVAKTSEGIKRFVSGLAKKIFIANVLGELCGIFRESNEKTVMFYWLYAIAYSLQIYFDFSGYSDMAIGLGKIFGFDFIENFNYPYISASVTEFWRRWHISLGSWFRDYIYIPLGGNRVPKLRWFFNILIVWLLTGFWHGASWNFIVWGLYFAFFLLIEKLFLNKFLSKFRFLGHIYVLTAVAVSFVIFGAVNLNEAISYIGGMFGVQNISLVSEEFVYYLKSYGFVLILAFIGATPLPKKITGKFKKKFGTAFAILEPCFLLLLMLIATAYLVNSSFNPFLYFRF